MKDGKRKNQKGFTLVELMMVIAVIGVIGLGAVIVFGKAMSKQRVNAEIQTLSEVTSAIQKYYFSKANFGGLSNTIAVSYKLVPDDMIVSAPATIGNRWAGSVTIAPATVSGANDSFSYTTTLVPSKECLDVVQALAPQYTATSVGGTVVKAAGGTLNETTLATQCNSAAAVTIVYTVSK